MKTDCNAKPTWMNLTCCSLPDSVGEGSHFSASVHAHRKVTFVATLSYSALNELNLTRIYFLLWRYSLVSIRELLATDGAAGVVSVILPFVSLLVDRPRVLRFWKQSITCTLWICLTNWQASTAVKRQRCRWSGLILQVLTGECTTVTVCSGMWNRMVWFVGTKLLEENPAQSSVQNNCPSWIIASRLSPNFGVCHSNNAAHFSVLNVKSK